MTNSLNWTEIEKEATTNKQYLDYAPNGEHTVKVKEATKRDNGNGWFEFTFEDTDYKFPKLSFAFFSDAKINYRAHYYKEVMKLLGCTEDQARKAVEVCEGKDGRESVFKAYADAFGKLAKKHPQMAIEVRDQYDRDGNPVMSASGNVYGESVFAKKSGLQFPSNGAKKVQTTSDPLEGAEEVELSQNDVLPF